jgi:hypothetical protein
LDNWRDWIGLLYFPNTDFTVPWKELLDQPEFERRYADYDDNKFKTCLEQISKRATEKSDLYDICDAILRSWNSNIEKSPNNSMQIDKELGTLPIPFHLIPSYPILSYHIPFYPILFYPILSYRILSYPILSYPILSYPILSYPLICYPILSYPILSSHILSYLILSYPILSYPIPSHPIISYSIVSYRILSYPILT